MRNREKMKKNYLISEFENSLTTTQLSIIEKKNSLNEK